MMWATSTNSIQKRDLPYRHIREFGAIGTPEQDATSAFVAAFASSARVLALDPNGTYRITALVARTGSPIALRGNGATIDCPGVFRVLSVTSGTGSEFSGLKFVGDETTAPTPPPSAPAPQILSGQARTISEDVPVGTLLAALSATGNPVSWANTGTLLVSNTVSGTTYSKQVEVFEMSSAQVSGIVATSNTFGESAAGKYTFPRGTAHMTTNTGNNWTV